MLPSMEPGGSRSFKVLTNIKFERVWSYKTKNNCEKRVWLWGGKIMQSKAEEVENM